MTHETLQSLAYDKVVDDTLWHKGDPRGFSGVDQRIVETATRSLIMFETALMICFGS